MYDSTILRLVIKTDHATGSTTSGATIMETSVLMNGNASLYYVVLRMCYRPLLMSVVTLPR